jgi:hypothetical protein
MNARRALTVVGLSCAIGLPVSAQVTGSVDQGEALRRQQEANRLLRDLKQDKMEEAPSISPDEATDVGPQSILRTRQHHRWFAVELDTQLYWTDNMFFNESDPVDTVGSAVLASSAQLSLNPPQWTLGEGKLRPRIGYQHVWMNYAVVGAKLDPLSGDPKSNGDFDAASTFADLTYTWGNYYAQLGLDWQRLLSHQPSYSSYAEFYRDYTPRWSLTRIFELSEKQAIILSYLGSHHFTNVDPTPGLNDGNRNDRTEHNILLNYSYQLAPRLILQPGYRFQFTHYTHESRLDLLNSFSASLIVPIVDWLTVRAFAGYELRDSDSAFIPDYRKLDSGLSLSANFKF